MPEILAVISKVSVLTFIITSMLAMGLSLTIAQIAEPLKDGRRVLFALLASFVLAPGLAFLITKVIPLDEGMATGLILVGAAAGAPFLPKLVQAAKGNTAFSVGLMTLLMVVTVIYLPVVLPILLPGASVNPWDIARSLIVMMLIPLGIGLFVKARYEDIAESLQPHMSQISSFAIVLALVTILVVQFSSIIGTIGSGGILAVLIFLAGALVIGLLLGVEGVLPDKPVDIFFLEYGDSARSVHVRWWIASYTKDFHMRDKVNAALETALDQAGIEMPFDTYNLNVQMQGENPSQEEQAAGEGSI